MIQEGETYSAFHVRMFQQIENAYYIYTEDLRVGDCFISFDTDGTPTIKEITSFRKTRHPGVFSMQIDSKPDIRAHLGINPIIRIPKPTDNPNTWPTIRPTSRIQQFPKIANAVKERNWKLMEQLGCDQLIVEHDMDHPCHWYKLTFIYHGKQYWVNFHIRISTPRNPTDGNPYRNLRKSMVVHGKQHIEAYQPKPWS